MKYFKAIASEEAAKQHYRSLSKRLHPDRGGTAGEFQKMQQEYKTLLLQLQEKRNDKKNTGQTPEQELLNKLGKLAKVLVKEKVPQGYLREKIKTAQSPLKKVLFEGLAGFLDGL